MSLFFTENTMQEKETTFFKIYHWTIISFGLYFLIYLFAAKQLEGYGIQFSCPYKRVTGQECPLCGVTRDFWNIFSFSSQRLNPLTNFIAYAFIAETVYRGLLFVFWKSSILWTHIRMLCVLDMGGHLMILLIFTQFCLSSLS